MIDHDRPVRVFKNWRHGCYSVMQDGVVKASARQVLLDDVHFLVRETGRRRMLRTRRKVVHAYAVGRLVALVHPDDPCSLEPLAGRKAFYDPYRFATFVDCESLEAVLGAKCAFLDETGLTYARELLPVAA